MQTTGFPGSRRECSRGPKTQLNFPISQRWQGCKLKPHRRICGRKFPTPSQPSLDSHMRPNCTENCEVYLWPPP
jgi:hypothetical protein